MMNEEPEIKVVSKVIYGSYGTEEEVRKCKECDRTFKGEPERCPHCGRRLLYQKYGGSR